MISLDSLNGPQRDAVTYQGKRHCLILAGAGSGKTRVLTTRMAYLLANGVPPYAMIAFTFTNKAAAEMRERAQNLVQNEIPDAENAHLQLSTFHSFGARFLRQYCEYIGLQNNYSIYGESEQKSLIKNIMADLSLLHSYDEILDSQVKKDNAAISDCMFDIMNWKEKGISAEQAKIKARTQQELNIANVYDIYEKRLISNNAVDFAGLLLWPLYIIRSFQDIRERIQNRYLHILVDEFQDTNGVQLDLLKSLMGPQTHITAVGDDDQSIYTWRGADPAAILEFADRFGECDVFKLEQNYRSTKPILNCAANLISCNAVRTQKRLWTDQNGGEPVHLVSYDSDRDEISGIMSQIKIISRNIDSNWGKFAILFRKNSMSIGFERACAERRIPYQLVGSMGFFEREEIADLMAYLRMTVNPLDTIALRRIINKPLRNIGDKTAERIIDLLEKKTAFGIQPSRCLIELLRDIKTEKCKIPRAGAKAIAGCADFLALLESLDNWRNMLPRDVLDTIVDQTHFMDHLKKSMQKKESDFEDAKERVQNLRNTLDAFQRDEDGGLAGFLESMALVRPEADEKNKSIKLMTIHSAKGLEFDAVFIAGAEEGVLPLERGGVCDIEEERRLMYVAMTRARKVLYISHASRRYEFGRLLSQNPSRFFEEMVRNDDETGMTDSITVPPQYDHSNNTQKRPKLAWTHHASSKSAPRHDNDFINEVGNGLTKTAKKNPSCSKQMLFDDIGYEEESVDIFSDVQNSQEHIPSEDNYASAQSSENLVARSKNNRDITVGSRVRHVIHGDGQVTHLERASGDYKATVLFKSSGKHTIIARFLEVI